VNCTLPASTASNFEVNGVGADGGAPVIGDNRGQRISNTSNKSQMLAVANSSVRHRYARVGTRASWCMMNSS
jgi:hypothetical protein